MKKFIIAIFAITIIGILFYYQHPWAINIMSNTRQQPINVTLGESCQQLANRYPGITSNDQQNGIKFCKIKATSGKEFPLTIHHGKHSITVPLVNSLSSVEHIKRNVGIDSLNITFSFSTAPTIMHDDARRALFAMFRQMHANGWKMFISLSKPRLRGRDTLTNQLPEKSKPSSLDPAYEPTLAEWMNIDELTKWKFYADQLYVDISFYRNSEKMDTSQPGEYLFTMDINTGETDHRGYFDSEQHAQWRKHWVDMALMLREERERAEAEARRIGLHIDTHYQDPPLPPPPPGMSNPTLPPELTQLRHVPLGTRAYSGAACPQTGLWQCLAPEAEAQTRMLQEGETMPKYTAAQPQQSRLWQWLAGTTPLAKYVEWKLINYG